VNNPSDDPIGTAISQALKLLAEAPVSQDLASVYACVGRQLADAGRQDAGESQVERVARNCAYAAVAAKTPWNEAADRATEKALSELHRDGLRSDEENVRKAAQVWVGHLLAEYRRNRLMNLPQTRLGPTPMP
jgi:hypothetical protein